MTRVTTSDDGHDTALARLLHREGRISQETLVQLLGEVRAARRVDPRASLADSLLSGGHVTREELSRFASRLGLPSAEGRLGPYQIVRALGRGAMGAVYEARHDQTGALHALKVLAPECREDEEFWRRFCREAEALGALDHPHLLGVHSADLQASTPYLALELMPGGSLQERLRGGRLPIPEAVRIALALADGLAHAHARGVLHRDLKPENVMFDERGQPRLADFGLALLAEGDRLTRTGTLLGTPAYMAPEQARAQPVDERADVYGLGGILHSMLTGDVPIAMQGGVAEVLLAILEQAPRPVRSFRPEVPPAIDAVCLRALAKRPEDRYPDVPGFAAALRAAARGEDAAPARLSRALLLGGGGMLLVLTGLALALLASGPARTGSPTPQPSASLTPTPTVQATRAWLPAAEAALEGCDDAGFLAATPRDLAPPPGAARTLVGYARLLAGDEEAAQELLDWGRPERAAARVERLRRGLAERVAAWSALRHQGVGASRGSKPGDRGLETTQQARALLPLLRELLAEATRSLPRTPLRLRPLLVLRVQRAVVSLVFTLGAEEAQRLGPHRSAGGEFLPSGGLGAALAEARGLGAVELGARELDAAELGLTYVKRPPREARPEAARALAERALAGPGCGPWRDTALRMLHLLAREAGDAAPGPQENFEPVPEPERLEGLTLLELEAVRELARRWVQRDGLETLPRLLQGGQVDEAARTWARLIGWSRAWDRADWLLGEGQVMRPSGWSERAQLHLVVLDPEGARRALGSSNRLYNSEDSLQALLLMECALLDGTSDERTAIVVRPEVLAQRERGSRERHCLWAALHAALGDEAARDAQLSQAREAPRSQGNLLWWRRISQTVAELEGGGHRRVLRDALLERGLLRLDETRPDW